MHTFTRENVIEGFRNLVWNVLKKFMRPGLDEHDLMQEGFCGLLKAYDRYDPERGVSFRTYAYPWVFAAMQTHVEAFSGPTHKSHGTWTRIRKESARAISWTELQWDESPTYDDGSLEESFAATDMVRKIDSQIAYDAIMFLPLLQQRVLLSYFFGEKSFITLSEELGLSKQRVHQIYKDAIAALQKRLRVKSTLV